MAIADPLYPAIEHGAGQPGVLDAADALARVMGDRALFARMLRHFRNEYQQGAAPIRSALARGDLALAHRLAHTLKGTAGMISAHALHRHAAALEQALRHGGHGGHAADAALDAVAAALAAVLAAIYQMQGGQAPPAGPPQSAAAAPDHLLAARLAALLDSGDGAALDLLEQSGARLAATLGQARFVAVALAVNAFDFEGALAALRGAAEADAEGNGMQGAQR